MLRTTYLHASWEFCETKRIGKKVGNSNVPWLPATVPGHVHLDLVENGVIADPFERLNELGCQWVDETDWSYRTTFEWHASAGLERRVLRFEGLDTLATVYLNDQKISETDNMFIPVDIDVTDLLKDGTNALRVDFLSAVNIGLDRRTPYLTAEGLGDKMHIMPERSFVRKAQYMYGWDWGPRLVSCGMWKPVTLVEFAGRITDVQVHWKLEADGSAVVSVESKHDGVGHPYHFLSLEDTVIGVPEGETLHIPDAAIWNPAFLGEQNMYAVLTLLLPEAKPATEGEAAVELIFEVEHLDRTETRFGIVETKLIREADQWGESFQLEVNGTKVWVRGANWIPDHSFPSIITRERYREQIEKAQDMGVNLLRVWGGGLYESDDFYEICDELGILVWQDFTFACALYPDDAHWQKVVAEEAEVNVRRIRNHASLAMWCGNNENHQLYNQRWLGDDTPEHYYGLPLYAEVIPSVLKKLDPARPYVPSSASGSKDEPLVDTNEGGKGDQHCWDVWHGRGDWKYYSDSTGRFSSEFGFCSAGSLSMWANHLDDADWAPHSAAVQWHDKTGKGDEKFHGYVELHYPKSESLEDWVYYSQLNQRDALRYGIEHYRRSEFCKGTVIWQINDCWPVTSWAFLDYEGNYKALGYELRRLYGEFLLSFRREGEKVEVWAIQDNSGEDRVEDSVVVTAFSTLTGEVLKTWDATFDIDDDTRKKVLEVDVTGLNVHETILVAQTEDADAWMLLGEPKEARLPAPSKLLISTAQEGLLQIRTDSPVVDLMLTTNGSTVGFEENFITAPMAGDLLIPITGKITEIEARSLAGDHVVVVTRSPI